MRTVLVTIIVALFGTTTAEAACHKYSRWYYPWPQKCGIVSKAAYEKPPLPPVIARAEEEFPLPDLAGIWSGEDKELQEQLERKKALILLLKGQGPE